MIEYTWHKDQGKPGFSIEWYDYSIITEDGERGRWLGVYPHDVAPGDKFRITCGQEGKTDLVITFWSGTPGAKTYLGSQALPHEEEIDEIVIIPNDTILIRVELRNWRVGFAIFLNVQVEYPYEEPPPIEPPIEQPYWAIYYCHSPSGEVLWTATVSEDSASISKGNPHSAVAFNHVDLMAATEPDFPAELLPPEGM